MTDHLEGQKDGSVVSHCGGILRRSRGISNLKVLKSDTTVNCGQMKARWGRDKQRCVVGLRLCEARGHSGHIPQEVAFGQSKFPTDIRQVDEASQRTLKSDAFAAR